MTKNTRQTGRAAAHAASDQLRAARETAAEKKVAASDLAQAPLHRGTKKKK